jgi:hypothetical protein
MAEKTIEQLREELARQILEAAIASDNPQYKVDAYKAVEKYGMKGGRSAEPATSGSPMAVFHDRVKRAEQGINGNGEPAETDQ